MALLYCTYTDATYTRPRVAICGFGLASGTLHRPCPSLIKQPRPPIVHLMLPTLDCWSGELCLPPPHAEAEDQVGVSDSAAEVQECICSTVYKEQSVFMIIASMSGPDLGRSPARHVS